MTNTNIIDSIKQITGFTDSELEIVIRYFEPRVVKKKTALLIAGNISTEVYFILSGCMRLYYDKEGVDISAYFFTEKMFAGAYDSFVSQKPSRHSIEAIEECQVLSISHKSLQELFTAFPKMNEFVRKVIEERFISLHELFTSLLLDTPEERYLNLVRNKPDLIKRIPQHQLATFIGVTPVSFSRIRNRVAKK